MERNFRYRGKNYSQEDIAFIRQLIIDNPAASRRALSQKLCIAWGWVQENGALRDQVCRNYMAYNSRFLILPWVRVKSLASHILSLVARQISTDWQKRYGHDVYYLETFIDTQRFTGTCYQAANWIYLGNTTGRGKNDQTGRANRSIKAVYGYPLKKNFRERLCERKKDGFPR